MSIDSTLSATGANNASSSFMDSLKLPTDTGAKYETEEERSNLTQEDFFSLLTQQLAYQDPFKPVENAEMISQMTAFSTAEGINSLNGQFENMNTLMSSSQALQASTLVGQNVLVQSSGGHSDGSGFSGVVAAEKFTNNMKVTIKDSVGQVINTMDLGDQASGTIKFDWDGTNFAGESVPEGSYTVTVSGLQDGKTAELPVAVFAKVDSVSLNSELSQASLNLKGLGTVSLSDVLEVAGG